MPIHTLILLNNNIVYSNNKKKQQYCIVLFQFQQSILCIKVNSDILENKKLFPTFEGFCHTLFCFHNTVFCRTFFFFYFLFSLINNNYSSSHLQHIRIPFVELLSGIWGSCQILLTSPLVFVLHQRIRVLSML